MKKNQTDEKYMLKLDATEPHSQKSGRLKIKSSLHNETFEEDIKLNSKHVDAHLKKANNKQSWVEITESLNEELIEYQNDHHKEITVELLKDFVINGKFKLSNISSMLSGAGKKIGIKTERLIKDCANINPLQNAKNWLGQKRKSEGKEEDDQQIIEKSFE